MHCILVFDHLNDVIFYKCDKKFIQHVRKLEEGCDVQDIEDMRNAEDVNINFVIQLFSPIVTSQRIMSSQFGNSYRSIQCDDGINMVFDEYMGFLFVTLALEDISWLKRMLGVCISIVQHLCGPDISMLKSDEGRRSLVSQLIETWSSLVKSDQSALVDALEQLFVNTDISAAAIKALKDSTDRVKGLLDYSKSHALLFVDNKFLALYSSKSAKELSVGDLLFLRLLTTSWSQGEYPYIDDTLSINSTTTDATSSDISEFYSPHSSPSSLRKNLNHIDRNGEKEKERLRKPEDNVTSELVLLSGVDSSQPVSPYVVHVSLIAPGVSLLLLYQTEWETVSKAVEQALRGVSLMTCSLYNEKEGVRRGMEMLEAAIKRLFDYFKKLKAPDLNPRLDAAVKVLHLKWDNLKKQYNESEEKTGVGSRAGSIGQSLKELFHASALDLGPVVRGHPAAQAISRCVHTALSHFLDFLTVKATTNFTLGSRGTLSINKYLEEFPGLVHFIYIDRTNHRVTAPSLGLEQPPSPLPQLTKEKIWRMVEFSRAHLEEGHLAIMWRDTSFNYAYYLWFEDISGSALTPKISPSTAVKTLPTPGVFASDFYRRLTETCFPKSSPGKVRCFELYCIHIGLATSSCVLEQSRRIAATICEVTGVPANPLDLL